MSGRRLLITGSAVRVRPREPKSRRFCAVLALACLLIAPLSTIASSGSNPSLYCLVDNDGQVVICHDTFEITQLYRCGGSGDRFNGSGPGVLLLGYELSKGPTGARPAFLLVDAWAFTGYGYNGPPEDTVYVFGSDTVWEGGFEACARLP